jgi:hypothetical protein
MTLFNHLLQPEFNVFDEDTPHSREIPVPDAASAAASLSIDAASPHALMNAQATTVSWLDQVGAHTEDAADPSLEQAARDAARNAFCSVTDPYRDPMQAKAALMALSAPPAVRHLAGMLTQYDWEFVKQAKEIRGFIVARLIEHSRSPDPKTSLPALKALGTVTEIGAFTERVEITRPPSDNTADAIVERLRERLTKLLPRSAPLPADDEVEDAVITATQPPAPPASDAHFTPPPPEPDTTPAPPAPPARP